jgi:hypothetical protein
MRPEPAEGCAPSLSRERPDLVEGSAPSLPRDAPRACRGMRPEPAEGASHPSVGIEVVGLSQPLPKLIIDLISPR